MVRNSENIKSCTDRLHVSPTVKSNPMQIGYSSACILWQIQGVISIWAKNDGLSLCVNDGFLSADHFANK